MSQQFKFSDPGEGLQEAEILALHVSQGDTVSDGDTILTIETDKASMEIPAPFDGTIEELRVAEGDTVEVGDVLLSYTSDDASDDASGSSEQSADQAAASPQQEQGADQQQGESGDDEQQSQQEPAQGEQAPARDRNRPVPAAPSTRRIAREQGVDLHEVEASGPQGRVTTADVEAHAHAGPAESESAAQSMVRSSPLTAGMTPPELPDFSQWGAVERMPLRSVRRATAENMARSWAQIPHVYHHDVADITALERFRRRHNGEHGKLTVTVLLMKALAGLLQRYPRFNASLDVASEDIVLKHYCHVGLAVATDHGLLVPVLRDVDRKSINTLADEAVEAARQAQDGELKPSDMQGASFTLTNVGPLGGTSLSPVINHPQVAILGVAQARWQPVVTDVDNGQMEPRLQLPLVLGFDHRVNDGADAANFVTELIRGLADPESLLLMV